LKKFFEQRTAFREGDIFSQSEITFKLASSNPEWVMIRGLARGRQLISAGVLPLETNKMSGKRAKQDDGEEEDTNEFLEEEKQQNEEKKKRRQTRADQRSAHDVYIENGTELEDITSSLFDDTRETVNNIAGQIIHTRELLHDAVLFKEASIILRKMALKMDDVSR
jgi:hypothetical protein